MKQLVIIQDSASVDGAMEKLKYRADIDGLRAIAVIGVLLFHAGLSFTGGFVGVDIFFVISGFLITSLILQAQQEDRFSIREFLARRIRRLMPAALAMTTVTLAIGYYCLIPNDYDKLAESAIAQMTLVSNVYFANSFDYFAGPAELVPLLHTWSLALEEQFYLLFPLLLIACRKCSRKKLVAILSGLTMFSFGLNLWAMNLYPTEAFFLLPMRAWELLLGALLVFVPKLKPSQQTLAECGSVISLAVIASTFFLYSKETLFPGSAALWPCLGTAGLIYFNNIGRQFRTHIAKYLETPALTYIGKISYSLYLWHWPIMVYLRYTNRLELEIPVALLGLALSFLAGSISYHFIESPFRLRRFLPTQKRLILTSSLFSLLIIGTGAGISEWDGLPARWTPQITSILGTAKSPVRYIRNSVWDPQLDQLPTIGSEQVLPDQPRLLVWGDSHAMVLGDVCSSLARQHNISGFIATRGGTLPVLDTYRIFDREDTLIWNEGVMDFIVRHEITHVIMAARWSDNIEGHASGLNKFLITDDQTPEVNKESARQVFQRNLLGTLQKLNDLGIRVWLMEQVPLQHHDPIYEVVTALRTESPLPRGVSEHLHADRQKHVRSIFDYLRDSNLSNVTIFDPAPAIFTHDGHARYMEDDTLFYVDHDHLSHAGAQRFIGPLLEPFFHEMVNELDQQNERNGSSGANLPQ